MPYILARGLFQPRMPSFITTIRRGGHESGRYDMLGEFDLKKNSRAKPFEHSQYPLLWQHSCTTEDILYEMEANKSCIYWTSSVPEGDSLCRRHCHVTTPREYARVNISLNGICTLHRVDWRTKRSI
ncbi:hypothetical protein ABKN59_002229 [Abortiporus biennis]